jgi:AcrR family transcriptional regulator
MARPVKGEARAAILEVADRLFYQDGVRAVGVDLLAAEAGITKRTLYYHFPTKEALITAYLTERDQPTLDHLFAEAEQRVPLPGDHVLGIFDMFEHWFMTPGYYGCPYLNVVAESGSKAETVLPYVTHHKDALASWIAAKLTAAAAIDPQNLAQQVMLLVDGALIRALIYRNGEIAPQARIAAATLLKSAGVALTAGTVN